MRESPELRATTLRFYERFSANDVASFDDLVSRDANLFIGTASDEWFTDRQKLQSGFGFDGLRLEPGDPHAYVEGSVGWVADQPLMHAPQIGMLRTRFSAVFHREDGAWKLVTSHFSVGVPDHEVIELQARELVPRGEPRVRDDTPRDQGVT